MDAYGASVQSFGANTKVVVNALSGNKSILRKYEIIGIATVHWRIFLGSHSFSCK
jgi:hypothetical protein